MDRLYERDLLVVSLRDARSRTLALYGRLDLESTKVPCIETVNPLLWEWAHIAWFQEFWCLRGGKRGIGAGLPSSRLQGADAMFDSARVPHASRWTLAYPSQKQVRDYMAATLEATLERLWQMEEEDLYFAHLCVRHEDMHGEALLMTLQQLALTDPGLDELPAQKAEGRVDISFARDTFRMGTAADQARFVFDNEMGAHDVTLEAFAIASLPTNQEEFLAFVEEGGYMRRELWTAEGWAWREAVGRTGPRYWRRNGREWQAQRFGQWESLRPAAAMVHVNLHEARAWCTWAGRRLPTEAEWEHAASRGEARGWRAGGVWEWTDTAFHPYPGFSPGPYREYSEPWFETHFVLRGGSFATRSRIASPRYRNFYLPHRDDPFAGFRTCAV